jgi:hypothetical protein
MKRELQVRLDEFRAGVDINLTQERVAGVNESMRRIRRNDDDAARFHLALFITDGDGGAAFEGKCDFNVGMFMQGWTLSGLRLDDVGRERGAVFFADEIKRHSNKRQLLEINEAHGANLREK